MLLFAALAVATPTTPNPLHLGPCTTWTGQNVIATNLNASVDPAWDAKKFFDNKTGITLRVVVRVSKPEPPPLALQLNISGDNGPLSSTFLDLCKAETIPSMCTPGKPIEPGNYTVTLPHFIAPYPPPPPGLDCRRNRHPIERYGHHQIQAPRG
jgi:hypothetical protein